MNLRLALPLLLCVGITAQTPPGQSASQPTKVTPASQPQAARTPDPKELAKTVSTPKEPEKPEKKAEDIKMPSSASPEDIRAVRGAQAMLAAEAKLKAQIKEGKIKGVDRVLPFEEISAWAYQDGLKGMPEAVKKLDGTSVMMTGFMLPIDEVENIKQFLLVQSLWSCCYGQPPDINGIVRVVMKGDKRVNYEFEPIKIIGQFKVKATVEDGYCVDIYQLSTDSVEVIK